MQIGIQQINQDQLNAFISNSISGGTFSGCLVAYYNATGYFGPYLLSLTGGSQTINGLKTFIDSIALPITTQTGNGVNYLQVLNTVSGSLLSLSGFDAGFYVSRVLDESITGIKTFISSPLVPLPTTATQATNVNYVLAVSGVIQNYINNINPSGVMHLTGTEHVVGQKIFDVNPLVATPTDPSGALNLGYLSNLNLTGVAYVNQPNTFTNSNTFTVSPQIPIGVSSNNPITVAQLNAAIIGSNNTGNGTVTSVNGLSGAVFIDGKGTVTVSECSGIIYVSGDTSRVTQFYSTNFLLPNGTTGIQYTYTSGFQNKPIVVGTLEFSGAGATVIGANIYNSTPNGFNVALDTAIPTNFYSYNVWVTPYTGSSGFSSLVGPQGNRGLSPNARGAWQVGLFYNVLDYVYTSPLNVSYITTSGHVSSLSNAPTSTGNLYWQVFSSGQIGPTGFWQYQGVYNTGTTYSYQSSVFSSGESFGFTGSVPVTNIYPQTLTGGWGYIAQKGAIGSQTFNSGAYITGSYSTVSFYCSPVLTGNAIAEAGVGANFNLTGYFLTARASGSGPAIGANGILSGNIYVVSLTNVETSLFNFTFDSGIYGKYVNGLAIPITGGYRLGVNITNVLSGIDKFSINLAGINGIS